MNKALVLAPALIAGFLLLPATVGRAAVTEAQFPPKTVRDLIELCGSGRDDPMMTAAVNYCYGFAQGAVIVEEAHSAQRGARKLFCLPNPAPAARSELSGLAAWANESPARLEEPSVDGLFLYLATKYPCGTARGVRR
jgi:Rap1a immunity proteins